MILPMLLELSTVVRIQIENSLVCSAGLQAQCRTQIKLTMCSSMCSYLATCFDEADSSHRPDDIIIPVMGITGSGKSTFIAHCTGDADTIGHGLESCTLNEDQARLPS